MVNTDFRLIRKWLRELDDHLESSKVVGPVVWGLNRQSCIELVQQLIVNLPSDLDQADRVLQNSDRLIGGAQNEASSTLQQAQAEARRIVEQAREHAERMLEEARVQQSRMIEQTEVYRIAEAQAREMRDAAVENARQIRQGADEYAYEVLTQLENALAKVMGTVQNGKVYIEDYLKHRVGTRR